jgi:hypothetical protein
MANSNTNKSTQPGESIHRARSYDSNTTDEGYHTDEKPKTEDQEIPILTSSYSM